MPSKNSKQTVQKTETPEVVTPVKAEPVSQQKGGKKADTKVAEPVTTPVEVKVTESTPKQKGGKKVAAKVAEPVTVPVEVKVEDAKVAESTPKQKGGKKVAAKTENVKVTESAPKQKVVKKAAAVVSDATPKQKGGKKAAPKKEKTPVAATEAEDAEDADGRRIRSFKVKLPNKEEFEGRFTGLTPYQAANKALSKYFRETEAPMVEVTFSICESTRKSKKSVYTYVGKRLKLEVPVTYQIQDGRQIVKNFKNSLKKVKKSETPADTA
jgi:hypothetical protein